MQYSKSTGYALHALLQLALAKPGQNVGIKQLSEQLGVSESYLSKIMSKLRQEGIVRAVTGVNGGYELARSAAAITFLDVIQVVEGRERLFECSTVNAHYHASSDMDAELVGSRDGDAANDPFGDECLVKKVMDGAELHLYNYLSQHTIQSVLDIGIFHNSCSGKEQG